MTDKVSPTKKGQFVALAMPHSYTEMHGTTKRWTEWIVGQVASASSRGIAKAVKVSGVNMPLDVVRHHIQVFTLPNHQEAARRIMASGRVFNSREDLGSAIKSAT